MVEDDPGPIIGCWLPQMEDEPLLLLGFEFVLVAWGMEALLGTNIVCEAAAEPLVVLEVAWETEIVTPSDLEREAEFGMRD